MSATKILDELKYHYSKTNVHISPYPAYKLALGGPLTRERCLAVEKQALDNMFKICGISDLFHCDVSKYLTKAENKQVLDLWYLLPGHTCYKTAWQMIKEGG